MEQKNSNIDSTFQYTQLKIAQLETKVLLSDIEMEKLKITNHSLKEVNKKQKRKNVFNKVGFGAGGIAIGIITGLIIVN